MRDKARLGDEWELSVEWFDSAWGLKIETLIGERRSGKNRIHLLSPRIRVWIQAVVRRQESRGLRQGAGIAVEVAVVVVEVVGAAAVDVAAAVGIADVVVAAAVAAVEVVVVVLLPW